MKLGLNGMCHSISITISGECRAINVSKRMIHETLLERR